MNATMSLNGKPRKQLADQLDRLDDMIDLLGEGLTTTVADAMKAGTAIAVKEALVEILTNPELLIAVRSAIPMPDTTVGSVEPSLKMKRPSLWSRLKAKMTFIKTKMTDAIQTICKRVCTRVSSLVTKIQSAKAQIQHIITAARTTGLLRSFPWFAISAFTVGLVTACVAYFTPHELLATAGGIGGALTTAAVQIGFRARRLIRTLIPITIS